MSPWLEGTTASGRTVYVIDDPAMKRDTPVLIDGEPAVVPRFGVRRMRDGGSTTIETDRGRIYWSRRLGRPRVNATLDGEEIVPSVFPPAAKETPDVEA